MRETDLIDIDVQLSFNLAQILMCDILIFLFNRHSLDESRSYLNS